MSKISAIITSGGSSSRFGSNKLLAKIDDYTVIEMTISKFLDLVDEIIIPCSEEVENHIKNSSIYLDKIKFAPAGKTRQLSVYNALLKCCKPDIVLIHDGARPYIDKKIIKQAIDLTFLKKAVCVGTMAIDTIKEVKNGKIIKTLDRNNIFQAQTPQCFDYDLIMQIHNQVKNTADYTDDSSMAEFFGIDVFILANEFKNNKITFKEDIINI